ncbi:hypothetical protein [Butyrivibrio sp. LC3010]|uniref:hypothetical protein n=1 Tax=Butyrivibrio sp. LC3010 TaxID=1280680 RepID=UPI000419128E|nr:hypothetical protein [Butyrivibrio sp. LC3010]
MIDIFEKILLGAVGLFVFQEFASYILNKIFQKAEKKIPSIFGFVKNNYINNFYKVKNSEDYKKFEYEYLREYYGDYFFSDTVTGGKIPVFSVSYKNITKADSSIRDYDILGNKENVDFDFSPENHQKYKRNKYYREYHFLVGSKIKAPDRPGYMLDELICDKDGKMEQFKGYVGTYAENVYSNHVLEYELFKLYRKRKKGYRYLIKKSRIRNAMHKSVCGKDEVQEYFDSMRKSLCRGEGRDSLLSVQMLVLIKNDDNYDIKIIQRSKEVAVAPERFQLVPSGGFEILNDSVSGYSKYEVEDNYSAGCAVFREYLEEIFGIEEFEGRGVGSVNEALMKDFRIQKINQLIKEGKADFSFLGSVIDLAGLRHELSFVLVIYDDEYNNQNQFMGNEECKNRNFISGVTLKNFEKRDDIWENLHGPSAAMWMLFKNSEIYKKLVEDID